MRIEPLVGPFGKLPILLRDDDTNFFTKDQMLETIYSEAWNKGFKVSLSIVPSQRGIDDSCVPPDFRQTGLLYSITNNESLIQFLKDKLRSSTIETLLHGFSHSIAKGYRGEFGINTSEQKANLNNAISIMNDAFGIRPSFFVPPYDDISYKNLKLVKKYGLIPIYGKENIHKFFRSPFIPTFFKKRLAKKIYHKFGKSAYVVPVIVNVVGSSDLNSNSVSNNNIREAAGYDNGNGNLCASFCDGEAINTLPPVGLSFEKLVSSVSFLDSISKIVSLASSNRNSISSLCIINHYHQYFYDWNQSISRTEMFETWQKLLSCLTGDIPYKDNQYLDFGWKTTFSELYNRTSKIRRTIAAAKTGSKLAVHSINDSEKIDNISFQISRGSPEISHVPGGVLFDRDTNIITIKEVLPGSKFHIYVSS
jgi:uncharacterized protein DUF2334